MERTEYYNANGAEMQHVLSMVPVQFDSIRSISLRNFASGFATFAVSPCALDLYLKVRKGFRKERKATEPDPKYLRDGP